VLAASQRSWLRALLPGCVAVASRSAPTSRSGVATWWYRRPLTSTSPASGSSSASAIRIVVDLPAPFGPTNPVTRPLRAVNVKLSTATVLPYAFERPFASMVASIGATVRPERPAVVAPASRLRPPSPG
jgi:hypothetical protein